MKYAKIQDGIVVQVQPHAQDGFEKVPDNVVCGQIKKGKKFENPPVVDNRTVQEKRHPEYPPIGDQLDAIMKWVAGENNLPQDLKDIAAQCIAVKAKYPKGK